MTCSLKDLPEKTPARVVDFQGESSLNQEMMEIGIRHNIIIQIISKMFFGHNYIIQVGNEQLVLRKHLAQCLKVTTSF